jgi:rod shape-determining protein MreD
MKDFSERLLEAPRRGKSRRLGPVALIIIPLTAILFQVYVPRFFDKLLYLELPLLVTVHFALSGRSPIPSVFYGAAIGLVQDSLSHRPIGLYGIVKTLVGYFASSVSNRFDVENPLIAFVLSFFFYVFHQFFYWVLVRALLGQAAGFDPQQTTFDPQQTIIYGLLNAAVAVPLFKLLDKMKVAA